uniref:J domain-containing protein n=1 Tax=Davidia involucrata TaxID=16924 RepID=A0A5B7BZE2_DAVIN
MECNKEEAIRAKGIAEKKMENKDFVGARKIALKAQQLYPVLDNISQMIMVCDVHCSSENKVYGNEMDWYGILKLEPTADEASIKKQYRKFALLLHPDKNKFAGATDAFKLIGEAQRVLLDREKRMLHDSKCRAFVRPVAPNWTAQQANRNSNVERQPRVQNNFMSNATSQFTGSNVQRQHPQQPTKSAFNRQTFWTVCPFCAVRYQYYKEVVNKLLFCQSCKSSFTGYEIKAQSTPPGTNLENPTSKVGSQRNIGGENPTMESFLKTGCTSKVGGGSKTNEKCSKVDMKKGGTEESKSSGKVNGKKRKHVAESSESCNTGSSTDPKEDTVIEEHGDIPGGQNTECYGEPYPRRSTRSKQHVSYNENLSDNDDIGTSSKRKKCSGLFSTTEQGAEDPLLKEEGPKMNEPAGYAADVDTDEKVVKQYGSACNEGSLQNGKEETSKANKKEIAPEDDHKKRSAGNGESSSNASPGKAKEPETYEYPDPDFSDFDKDRKEDCFAVGQTWAVYDTLDAMPRFYARIRKVFSPGFKLRITWLEPDPDDEDEIKWVEEGLPVSCGKFKHGNSENTEDHPMFSHLVYWEKGSRRDTYKIYPIKGETWALFKNWDINWYSDSDSERKYEFEFVEVLSDYVEGVGVSVAYLGKVKGFSCLFCRTMKDGMDSLQLPPNELFRFSHKVPSFQMSGEERKDVPKGSFELDPASLPTDLEEIAVPEDLNVETGSMHPNGSCSKSPADMTEALTGSEGNGSICQADKKTHLDFKHNSSDHFTEDTGSAPPTPEAYEIPEPEFYNFDDDKSPEKFQIGQIWALYSDEDGLPKYYGLIKKIESQPEFKLHIMWLVSYWLPKDTIHWLDKKMPICCGRFKLTKEKSHKYTSTASFSHQLRAELMDKKDVYAVFPRKGEVWALYKNWNAGIKCSELENCDYDMVEILEENDLWIEVSVVELVDGYKSVFKPQMKEGSTVKMKIPQTELLRFSHQIPAFRLTEEKGGSLRGFWELDPAALPVILFCSS